MANIELRRRYLGEGVVGEVGPVSLSWSDRAALESAAAGAVSTSAEIRRSVDQLASLGLDVRATAGSIATLEGSLGLRLDAQTAVLRSQLDLLNEIAVTLRTPAKTRAAERLVDIAELLAKVRWKRALELSHQVTDDDPNNPEGYVALGRAALGLGELAAARDSFIEGAHAADSLRRSQIGRLAARLTDALDGPAAALAVLSNFGILTAPSAPWPPSDERTEFAAVAYDRAVFSAEQGDAEAAIALLRAAGDVSPLFLAEASASDSVLRAHPQIVEAAHAMLAAACEWQDERTADQEARAEALLTEAQELDTQQPVEGLRAFLGRLEQRRQDHVPVSQTEVIAADRDLEAFAREVRDAHQAQRRREQDRLAYLAHQREEQNRRRREAQDALYRELGRLNTATAGAGGWLAGGAIAFISAFGNAVPGVIIGAVIALASIPIVAGWNFFARQPTESRGAALWVLFVCTLGLPPLAPVLAACALLSYPIQRTSVERRHKLLSSPTAPDPVHRILSKPAHQDSRTCPSCGASNRADRRSCWSCSAELH